jgi:hypothetical protein
LSLLEHPVGLADAGGHSQQDPVAAPHATTLVGETFHERAGALAVHVGAYAPNTLWMIRSISLIPMNGRITPPRP